MDMTLFGQQSRGACDFVGGVVYSLSSVMFVAASQVHAGCIGT